jgi:hypothetical protein
MRRTPAHVTLFVAALAAALTGCSKMPTAPSVDTSLARDHSAPGILQMPDLPPPVEGGFSNAITIGVGDEGTIVAGNFSLVIHKNSLKMPATIKIMQPDPNVLQATFEVTPPEANDFQVPVQLQATCANSTLAEAMAETVYWWDGGWAVAGNVSLDHKALIFSSKTNALSNVKVDALPPPDDTKNHGGN